MRPPAACPRARRRPVLEVLRSSGSTERLRLGAARPGTRRRAPRQEATCRPRALTDAGPGSERRGCAGYGARAGRPWYQAETGTGVPQFFEISERSRVFGPVVADRDRDIVTAMFTLDPNLPREPPRARVIEEQRFRDGLQQIDEIVVTLHVGEFVRDDRLQLSGDSPANALAGTRITGRSQPMTIGVSTRLDSTIRTAHVTRSRCAIAVTRACHVSGTGLDGRASDPFDDEPASEQA